MISEEEIEELIPYVKVVAQASEYIGCDDFSIFSAALKGLLEAAKNFDPSKGTKFKSYANRIVKHRIADYKRGIGYRSDNNIGRVKHGCDIEHVHMDLIPDGSNNSISDIIKDEKELGGAVELEIKDKYNILHKTLSCCGLTKQEKEIIELIYFKDLKMIEVAAIKELTTSRIHQIKTKALSKIKNKFELMYI
jgi:RNA polymerase sigma factor (sigma-70 family)